MTKGDNVNQLTKKQRTRVRVIRAIARDTTGLGCTASRAAKLARLHPSTVRRHLAEMREDPQEGLAVHLTYLEASSGFTYRALSVPRVRLRRRRKSPKRVRAPQDDKRRVVALETRPSKTVSVTVRIVRALENPMGIYELGQALRVRRSLLQRELDALGNRIVKERSGGRWIYTLVA